MRTCTQCNKTKDDWLFHNCKSKPGGKFSACADCRNARTREHRAKYRSTGPRHIDIWQIVEDGEKTCKWCLNVLPVESFSISRETRTGLQSHCKKCANDRTMEHLTDPAKRARKNKLARAASKRRRAKNQMVDGVPTGMVLTAPLAERCQKRLSKNFTWDTLAAKLGVRALTLQRLVGLRGYTDAPNAPKALFVDEEIAKKIMRAL